MTDLEKVQTAIKLITEVKLKAKDGSTIQMLLEDSIYDLESLKRWINTN